MKILPCRDNFTVQQRARCCGNGDLFFRISIYIKGSHISINAHQRPNLAWMNYEERFFTVIFSMMRYPENRFRSTQLDASRTVSSSSLATADFR